jgi:hypothetical protein
MNPYDDEILDLALEEVLGGKKPPDLTARILTRLEPRRVAAPGPPTPRPPRPAPDFWRGASLAAAAVLLAWAVLWPGAAPRRVDVEVLAGVMTWTGRAGSTTCGQGRVLGVPLLPGDRIGSGAAANALFFKPLGTLRMAQGSWIEVKDMDWKQFGGGAALGGITVAVIAGAVTWHTADASPLSGAQGETLPLRGSAAEVSGTGRTADAGESELADELARAQARIRELELAQARRAAAVPLAPDTASKPAAPDDDEGKRDVRFTGAGVHEALLALDWNAVGEATKNLLPLITELAEKTEETGELPLDVIGQLQRWNGDLITAAMKLVEHEVPGTGVNGAFTHPLVVANQLDSLFDKAGMPMTELQQEDLDTVAQRFVRQDDIRRSGYFGDTPALRKVIDEMELKDRFYEDAERLLTPAQQKLIWNDATRGRTSLDVFSSGLAWGPLAKPIEATDRNQLVARMTDGMARDLELSPGDQVKVREIVSSWSQGFPEAYWKEPVNALTRKGVPTLRVQQIRTAAKQQLAMIEALLNTLSLTEAQKKKLINEHKVYIPYLK